MADPHRAPGRSTASPGPQSAFNIPVAHGPRRPAEGPRDARPPRVVIIGAGPTGLGAAYRLKELGYTNFHVYERNPYIGGLAHSFTDKHGFTWDIGGHVMFSHYSYYDRVFERLMGDEYTLNNRESWVRMFDRWVPYPFQNNIRYLPKQAAYECLSGLIRAQSGRSGGGGAGGGGTGGGAGGGVGGARSPAEARNFGEFIDAVFGEGIARHFMRPYNFKVWAHPPEMMNKQWIGERVAVIDVDRAVRNVVLEQDDFGWGPNNQFKFPLRGGTGEFYARFGPALEGHVTLGKSVAAIDPDRKEVRFTDGETAAYDVLVSTMPLDVLCRDVLKASRRSSAEASNGDRANWEAGDGLDRVAQTASRLRHSGGYMVGIGIRRDGGSPSTKSWMYFPEDNCPFYRVTYLSNYSPYMTPDRDRYYSLLCETSYSDHKPVDGERVVEQTIQGLVNAGMIAQGEVAQIVSRWCYHAAYSYPTPTVDRDEILADVIPWLERRDIYSRGRFGMWKYEVSNTDHSLMQGVELVNRLLLGDPETTIGMVYRVTEDGREAAVHERAPAAGSGDPRKPAPGAPSSTVEETETAAREPRVVVRGARAGDVDEADPAEEELGVTQRRDG